MAYLKRELEEPPARTVRNNLYSNVNVTRFGSAKLFY